MRKITLRKMLYGAMLVVAGNAAHAQGVINTIAGTGVAGSGGDGGPAAAAQFSNPYGVATDAAGNIYIADKSNSKVRVISATTGHIFTFAGSTYGLSGMGGPATLAQMKYPDGVFVNHAGDVIITDWYNDMTYYVDHTTGNIASRCGCGSQGCGGDGGPSWLAKMMTPAGSCEDLAGNTYIADKGSNRIRRVDALTGIVTTIANGTGTFGYSGDGGPAINANFSGPSAVFFDPTSPGLGHLYLSDGGNNVIRKIDLNTGRITTVAGTGVAGYSGNGSIATMAKLRNPGNLFIDNSGNMFVCDRGNHSIRKIVLSSGRISTIAGTGVAGFSGDGDVSTNARLKDPQGVWMTSTGYMFIADAGNQRIRVIAPKTGTGYGFIGGSSTIGAPKSDPISTVLTANEVRIFPNPSNGIFTVATGVDNANASVTVLNVVGEQVYGATLTSQQSDINLSNQPAGIYTVIVKSNVGTHNQKITIQ